MAWIVIDGSYPTQSIWEGSLTYPMIPYPSGVFNSFDDYPEFSFWRPINEIPTHPFPSGIFTIYNDYPKYYFGREELFFGAFNSSPLKEIKGGNNLESIGKYSFRNTELTAVTLPQDCTYYNTSFPEDCTVTGGTIIT